MAAGAAGVRVSQPQLPFPVPKLALGTPAALPAPRGGGRRVSQRGPARLTAMEIFRNPPHPLPGPSMTAEASRTAQPARRPPPWAPRFPSQPGRFGLCELPNTSLVSRRARAPRGGASPSPLPARRCSAQINADEALAAGAAGSPACAWGPPQPVPGHLGPAQGARCGRDLPPPRSRLHSSPSSFCSSSVGVRGAGHLLSVAPLLSGSWPDVFWGTSCLQSYRAVTRPPSSTLPSQGPAGRGSRPARSPLRYSLPPFLLAAGGGGGIAALDHGAVRVSCPPLRCQNAGCPRPQAGPRRASPLPPPAAAGQQRGVEAARPAPSPHLQR